MAEETGASAAEEKASAPAEPAGSDRVFIRALPKIVFLYPTCLMALLCCILQAIFGGKEPSTTYGIIFFITLALNLPVVAFDFSRKSFVILILLIALLVVLKAWTPVFEFVGGRNIAATTQFYAWFGILLATIFVAVFIRTRFDYWELTHNELLHHHGILGDVERYPAPGLRITKEVDDVVEFLLLGAGRLVIQAPVEQRAIVLESVPMVNRIENRLKEVLSTLQVKVGTPS